MPLAIDMFLSADVFLPLLAASALLLWLAMSGWILADRLLYDARNRGLGWASRELRAPALAALPLQERLERVRAIVHGLPMRSLERLVMDTSLPRWVRDACSAEVVRARDPEKLLAAAAGASGTRKWTHIAALFLLVRDRHPSAHALLGRALQEDDLEVRQAAITLLGEIGDREAARILAGGAAASSVLRSRIAGQLDRFALPIVDLIAGLATSPDPAVRALGAMLLWRHAGEPDVARRLLDLASDVDPGVRKSAVQSLAGALAPEAGDAARRLLADPVPFVRAHAARALVRLDPAHASNAIAQLLADPDWWVRQAAKEGLVAIGIDALPAVVPQLDSDDRFARNGAADVLQGIGAVPGLVARAAQAGAEGEAATALLRKLTRAGERDVDGGARHPSWQISRNHVPAEAS